MTTKVETWRHNDTRYLRVALQVTGETEYLFTSNDQSVRVVSTSNGYIFQDRVVIRQPAEILLEAPVGGVSCESRCAACVENMLLIVPQALAIRASEAKPLVIRTVSKKYKDKMNEFLNIVQRKRSSWIIELEDGGDLVLSVISSPNEKRLMCVGGASGMPSVSDFIFPMFPGKQIISIPREVLKANRVAVYELAVPDFTPSSCFYHKIIASNVVGEE